MWPQALFLDDQRTRASIREGRYMADLVILNPSKTIPFPRNMLSNANGVRSKLMQLPTLSLKWKKHFSERQSGSRQIGNFHRGTQRERIHVAKER